MFDRGALESEKIRYCRSRFQDWLVTCFEYPYRVRVSNGLFRFVGCIVLRSPDGFTLGALVDNNANTDAGTLGVALCLPGAAGVKDEIAVGLGPRPWDSFALTWALAQHWMVCRCRQSGRGGRAMCMKDSILLQRWHSLTLLSESDYEDVPSKAESCAGEPTGGGDGPHVRARSLSDHQPPGGDGSEAIFGVECCGVPTIVRAGDSLVWSNGSGRFSLS